MTDIPGIQAINGVPTYLGRGDPSGRFADYYPAWMDKLAGDATLEGSLLDGAVQGADAIRAIIGGVRQLYDRQDFNFAGPWREDSFIEDYTAEVGGRPLGCLHLVTFNADGQTQHVAAHTGAPSPTGRPRCRGVDDPGRASLRGLILHAPHGHRIGRWAIVLFLAWTLIARRREAQAATS